MHSRDRTTHAVGPDAHWLEAIHQQWVATLDAIRDAILVVDANDTVLRVNRRFAAMADRPIRAVIGRPIAAVAPWLTDAAGAIATHAVTAANGRVVCARPCETDPRLAGRIYVLEDVTAEHALAAAEASFRAGQVKASIETVATLSQALQLVDPYTSRHGASVAELARRIALAIGYDELRAQGIYYGALIHDLGKLSVPGSILTRPGRLAQAEMNLVRMHPETGYSIVKDLAFPWPVHDIVLQHHERLDGSGYPAGLKGDEISEAARIVAVADVAEAMSAHRPYRPSLGVAAAVRELEDGRARRYDPRMVDACLRLIEHEAALPQLGDTEWQEDPRD